MASIISKLKNEGNLVLYLDFRRGTVDDLSGNNVTRTRFGGGKLIDGGYATFEDGYGIAFDKNDIPDFSSSGYTAMIFGDFRQAPQENGYIWSKRDVEFSAYFVSAGYLSIYNGGASFTLNPFPFPAESIGVTADPSDKAKIFVDGGKERESTGAPSIPHNPYDFGVCGHAESPSYMTFPFVYKAFVLASRPLTETEMQQLHDELVNIKYNKHPYIITSPSLGNIDLSDAVIALNGVTAQDGLAKWKQIVGNYTAWSRYFRWTIEDTPWGKAPRTFQENNSKVIILDDPDFDFATEDFTVEIIHKWVQQPASFDYLFAHGAGGGSKGWGWATPYVKFEIYPSGGSRHYLYANTSYDYEWHHYVATVDRDGLMKVYKDGVLQDSVDISAEDGLSLATTANLEAGRGVRTQAGSFIVPYAACHRGVKSEEWVQNQYDALFANKGWTLNYDAIRANEVDTVGPGYMDDGLVYLHGGQQTIRMEDVTYDGETKKCKVLYNSGSAGFWTLLPSKIYHGSRADQAHGTIEFMCYIPAAGGLYFEFAKDRQDDYLSWGRQVSGIRAEIWKTDGCRLRSMQNGTSYLSTDYMPFPNEEWLKVRITRDNTKTYLYINGELKATLSTTNPVFNAVAVGGYCGGGAKIILASEDNEWSVRYRLK